MNNDKPAIVKAFETPIELLDAAACEAVMDEIYSIVDTLSPGVRRLVDDMVRAAYRAGKAEGMRL